MSKVSQQFAEGELVNVSIRGARVGEVLDRSIRLDYPNAIAMVLPFHHAITVERVAPAEWPPQPNDLWAGADDGEWFCAHWGTGVRLIDEWGESHSRVDEVSANHGPMRLVRRRGWTPPAETTPAEPEQVDERTELVAGLRAAADLLEKRPDLYVASAHLQTYYLNHGDDVAIRAAIERDAASLGVKLTERPHTTEDLVVISGVHRLSKNVEFVLHASVKPTGPERPTDEALPVVMYCCNARYATVAETVGHQCDPAAVQPDEPAGDDVPADEEPPPDAPSVERIEVGTAGCGCPITEEIRPNCSSVEGTERTEHRPGCWELKLPRRTTLADVPPAPSVPLSADDELLTRALTALEGGEQTGGAA